MAKQIAQTKTKPSAWIVTPNDKGRKSIKSGKVFLEDKEEFEIESEDVSDVNIKNIEVLDYKKLSLNKLRSIVIEKGVVTDASKLKKHELLKLLEVE
jgi:hypothetical protein